MIYQESAAPFGLFFVDIDHFKVVNDTFGHEIGDKVIRMVANTLRHNLRATDTMGRWGGEEFVILLNEINSTVLETVAKKLHLLVSQSRLDSEQGSLSVTISHGGTLIRKEDTIEVAVQRADELMYASKNAGRNRVTVG